MTVWRITGKIVRTAILLVIHADLELADLTILG